MSPNTPKSCSRGSGGTILRGKLGPNWTPRLERRDVTAKKDGRVPVADRYRGNAFASTRYNRAGHARVTSPATELAK